MIQTLLKYGNDANQSQLTSQKYVFDTPNAMDDADLNGQNIGLYSKSKFFDESKTVDFRGTYIIPYVHLIDISSILLE